MTLMQRLRGLRRSGRGQSLVEFAMVLPLLLVIVFLVTEFGRALFVKNTLTQAAREGVRQAVTGNVAAANKHSVATTASVAFLTEVGLYGTPPNPNVTVSTITVNGRDFLKVEITHDFSFVPNGQLSANPFGNGAFVIPTGFTIQSEAIMMYENI